MSGQVAYLQVRVISLRTALIASAQKSALLSTRSLERRGQGRMFPTRPVAMPTRILAKRSQVCMAGCVLVVRKFRASTPRPNFLASG